MGAARLLLSRPFHIGAAAAVLTTVPLIEHRRPRVHLEAPPTHSFPQDARLISNARKAQNQLSQAQTESQVTKRGDADLIHHATAADTFSPGFEDDDDQSWSQFSRNFDMLIEGISRIQWGGIGDRITEFVVPAWARHLPELIRKLQSELSMAPGTLADDVWREAHDPNLNPEILWDARVRVGNSLGHDELQFRQRRRQHILGAFAKYLDIKESEIDLDDIPTIALCGSGGGLRALVAGTSSYLSAQEAGLLTASHI